MVGIHFAHRIGAAIVSLLVVATAARIAFAYREDRGWLLLAALLILLLVLQVTLGATIVWTRKAVLPTTAHVAIGAALLAASLVAALRCRRRRAASEMWIAEPIAERAHA
jgi:heme A synthase